MAVLPFRSHSLGADDAFLADGITRDLTMLLSRVSRLRVSAYSSAAMIEEQVTPLSEISNRLGVRYAVSGSLSRRGDMFQVRAALMDTFDDAQIWAQRIDAPLEGFFDIEHKLVLDISTSIVSALQMSFYATIQGRRPFQLSAYELVQRAESLRLRYNRDTAMEIVELLDRALTMDPNDGAIHAALAVQHAQNVVSHFDPSPKETFALARQHVATALELAPQDPDVLAAAGIAAAMMGNARLAVRNLRQSIALDPNNPHHLAVLGWQHCWLQGDRAGIEMIETAEQRAPHHPRFAVWAHYRGHCEIRLGRTDAAIAAYRESTDRNPQYSLNLVTLAAALAHTGKLAEAREVTDQIARIAPGYSVDEFERLAARMVYWFGDSPNRGQLVSALRDAWVGESVI
ncbi:MAG TPA: tetratricopeptide repeat protein [Dokdonella sp.]|uniref:tetratricopeptide repeat protein n=1 Tax=Dokdonella sp. TaxID=2291710 RepID=UPI002D8079A3|nr:tetratricopeptide repeat protein [Dokdonella sp.]HET9033092.1 tetratricopeptide repeat protein [Dokdonella sp.]